MNYNQLQNELSLGALEWVTERNLIKKMPQIAKIAKNLSNGFTMRPSLINGF
jgi:hypothetical protein